MVERVVFMQDEGANEALALLDDQGEEAVVEFLAQWHYPGEHETNEEPGAGSSDRTFETDDGYILTYNTRLGYIGLEYRV